MTEEFVENELLDVSKIKLLQGFQVGEVDLITSTGVTMSVPLAIFRVQPLKITDTVPENEVILVSFDRSNVDIMIEELTRLKNEELRD